MAIETVEQLRAILKDRNIAEVARRTGLSRFVIYNFMSGRSSPRYDVCHKLIAYVEGR